MEGMSMKNSKIAWIHRLSTIKITLTIILVFVGIYFEKEGADWFFLHQDIVQEI